MATKKQKRAAALAKREAYMEKVKQEGLAALARAKEHEKKVREERVAEALKEFDDELLMASKFAKAIYVGGTK